MVAPKKLKLRIGEKRIGKIFGELTSLRAEVFPNAGGVLFRVFLELSCDHYVHANTIGTWSDSLAKKMKATAEHLMQAGKIEKAVKDMVAKNADSERFFAAAAVTFHQYVHNRKTSPKPQDLIDGWDELEPFFVALWP